MLLILKNFWAKRLILSPAYFTVIVYSVRTDFLHQNTSCVSLTADFKLTPASENSQSPDITNVKSVQGILRSFQQQVVRDQIISFSDRKFQTCLNHVIYSRNFCKHLKKNMHNFLFFYAKMTYNYSYNDVIIIS